MTTISTYEQSAIDFLKETNTTFISSFHSFEKYFPDDLHSRNVFNCTLQNDKHKYTFKFGSSLKDSLKNVNTISNEDTIDFYCGLKFEGMEKKYLSISQKIKIQDIRNIFESNSAQWFTLLPTGIVSKVYEQWKEDNTIKATKYRIGAAPKFQLREWQDIVKQKLIRSASQLNKNNWGIGVQADEIIHPTAYDVLAAITKYPVYDFEDFCGDYGYDSDSRKAYKIYKAVKKEWENISLMFSQEQLELLQEIN